MEQIKRKYCRTKKKERAINREYNTALYLLRCTQLGLRYEDLENLTYGMVQDIFIESSNDKVEYDYVATQTDFDNF